MTISTLLKPEIDDMLKSGDFSGLRALSEETHPADMAEVVENVPEDRRLVAYLAIHPEMQSTVFEYLETDIQHELLAAFTPEALSNLAENLSPDDRTELLDELPGAIARRVLEVLSPEDRKRTLELLNYPNDSAGRLMTPDFLWIGAEMTAQDALQKVRRLADEVEMVYVLYVIDKSNTLIGTVSLRDVVIAEPDDVIRDIMTQNIVSCHTSDDREEVLYKMREYDLLALPVVDRSNALVGIVTFDDVSDVHAEEATEDILKMHGVATEQDDYFSAGVFKKYRQRVVWLVSLAFVGAGSVLVQQEYNPVIAQLSLLAVYITLLTASGGNCGTQSAGILIRAISTGNYTTKQVIRIMLGEIAVGFALSATMAAMGCALVLLRGADPNMLGGHSVSDVAVIVGLAMFLAVGTANALGAAIPLLLEKLKVDPAVAAGPFITTAADIVTVLIYFNIAQWAILGV